MCHTLLQYYILCNHVNVSFNTCHWFFRIQCYMKPNTDSRDEDSPGSIGSRSGSEDPPTMSHDEAKARQPLPFEWRDHYEHRGVAHSYSRLCPACLKNNIELQNKGRRKRKHTEQVLMAAGHRLVEGQRNVMSSRQAITSAAERQEVDASQSENEIVVVQPRSTQAEVERRMRYRQQFRVAMAEQRLRQADERERLAEQRLREADLGLRRAEQRARRARTGWIDWEAEDEAVRIEFAAASSLRFPPSLLAAPQDRLAPLPSPIPEQALPRRRNAQRYSIPTLYSIGNRMNQSQMPPQSAEVSEAEGAQDWEDISDSSSEDRSSSTEGVVSTTTSDVPFVCNNPIHTQPLNHLDDDEKLLTSLQHKPWSPRCIENAESLKGETWEILVHYKGCNHIEAVFVEKLHYVSRTEIRARCGCHQFPYRLVAKRKAISLEMCLGCRILSQRELLVRYSEYEPMDQAFEWLGDYIRPHGGRQTIKQWPFDARDGRTKPHGASKMVNSAWGGFLREGM